MSQALALRTDTAAREEVLLELFPSTGSHDGSESAAYRRGKYKVRSVSIVYSMIFDIHVILKDKSDGGVRMK